MVKKSSKIWNLVVAMTALCLFMAGTAWASVTLYAEGAYTDDNLKVYVYADVTPGAPIVSFGVKLTYDSSKVKIPDSAACLQRNEGVWFFGDPDGTTYDTPSAGPNVTEDTSGGPSSVVFVGGKIDSRESATQGVDGDRILLGIVTFTREDMSDWSGATNPNKPVIGVELGKDDPYQNFVQLDSAELDPSIASSTAVIWERGDANANGVINVQDILRAKSLIGNPDAPPYADCNDSGDINVQDILCIKSKL